MEDLTNVIIRQVTLKKLFVFMWSVTACVVVGASCLLVLVDSISKLMLVIVTHSGSSHFSSFKYSLDLMIIPLS